MLKLRKNVIKRKLFFVNETKGTLNDTGTEGAHANNPPYHKYAT